MSTFENEIFSYLRKGSDLPAWAKAERYEFCEPYFNGVLTAKKSTRKNALSRILLSVVK